MLLRLHAFGNAALSEIGGEIDHGFNDLLRFDVLADFGDEAAVDFDVVEMEVPEVGQGGETGPEIVEGDRHAPFTQLEDRRQYLFRILVHKNVFGDFDGEIVPIERVTGHRVGQHEIAGVGNEGGFRHVDGHGSAIEAGIAPGPDVARHPVHDNLGHRCHR